MANINPTNPTNNDEIELSTIDSTQELKLDIAKFTSEEIESLRSFNSNLTTFFSNEEKIPLIELIDETINKINEFFNTNQSGRYLEFTTKSVFSNEKFQTFIKELQTKQYFVKSEIIGDSVKLIITLNKREPILFDLNIQNFCALCILILLVILTFYKGSEVM